MFRIYKYPVDVDSAVQIIELPKNAQIISAGLDPGGEVCLWAVVDDKEARRIEKTIYCIGTGWPIDLIVGNKTDTFNFIGTVKAGPYMWHYFEGSEREVE